MNGFTRSAVVMAAAVLSLCRASNATAEEMQTTIRVSLNILPTLNTRFAFRALPDGRVGFDNGVGTLDLAAIDFSLRADGVTRRFLDARSALDAIEAEKKKTGEPAAVTIVF